MEPEPELVLTDATTGRQNSPVRERSSPPRSRALRGNVAAALASGQSRGSGSTAFFPADLVDASPTASVPPMPPPPPVGADTDSAESSASKKADLWARRQRRARLRAAATAVQLSHSDRWGSGNPVDQESLPPPPPSVQAGTHDRHQHGGGWRHEQEWSKRPGEVGTDQPTTVSEFLDSYRDMPVNRAKSLSAVAGIVQFKEELHQKKWRISCMVICPAAPVVVDTGVPMQALLIYDLQARKERKKNQKGGGPTEVKPLRYCSFEQVQQGDKCLPLPTGISTGYVINLSSTVGVPSADECAFYVETKKKEVGDATDAQWAEAFRAVEAIAEAEVLMQARLELQGQKLKSHEWTQHHFELRGPVLSYYDDERKKLGAIHFENPNTDVNLQAEDPLRFEVLSPQALFVLRCSSEKECQAWVSAMRGVKELIARNNAGGDIVEATGLRSDRPQFKEVQAEGPGSKPTEQQNSPMWEQLTSDRAGTPPPPPPSTDEPPLSPPPPEGIGAPVAASDKMAVVFDRHNRSGDYPLVSNSNAGSEELLSTTFSQPGPIGMQLQERRTDTRDPSSSYIVLDRIKPGSQAAKAPGIRPGLRLKFVGDVPVERMTLSEVTALLKHRPLTIKYVYEDNDQHLYGATREGALRLGVASELVSRGRRARVRASDAGSRPTGQQTSPVQERSSPPRTGALGGNLAAALASGRLHDSGSTAVAHADLSDASLPLGPSIAAGKVLASDRWGSSPADQESLPPPPPLGAPPQQFGSTMEPPPASLGQSAGHQTVWEEPPQHNTAGDEVAAAFERYNSNGDGLLSLKELRVLLDDADYQVDASYLHGLRDLFGKWDTDGSGGIELGEFRELWAQLDLGRLLQQAGGSGSTMEPPPASLGQSAGHQTVWEEPPQHNTAGDEVAAAFERYNSNGDGLLSLKELRVLLDDADYQVDASYLHGLRDLFGKWDTDGSGGIELGEFRELWAQLDLGRLLQQAGGSGSTMEPPPASLGQSAGHQTVWEEPPQHNTAGDEVAAAFERYNSNGDGLLSLKELRVLLDDADYQVDASYLHGLRDLFGKWDTDGSGGIELGEFRELWAQLDLGRLLQQAGGSGRAIAESEEDEWEDLPDPDPESEPELGAVGTTALFQNYDTNHDGVLDEQEVAAMVASLKLEVDASFSHRVVQIFGLPRGAIESTQESTTAAAARTEPKVVLAKDFANMWKHIIQCRNVTQRRDAAARKAFAAPLLPSPPSQLYPRAWQERQTTSPPTETAGELHSFQLSVEHELLRLREESPHTTIDNQMLRSLSPRTYAAYNILATRETGLARSFWPSSPDRHLRTPATRAVTTDTYTLELDAEYQRLRKLADDSPRPHQHHQQRPSPLVTYLLSGTLDSDDGSSGPARVQPGRGEGQMPLDRLQQGSQWSDRLGDSAFTLPAPEWPEAENTAASDSLSSRERKNDDADATFNAVMTRLRNLEAGARISNLRRRQQYLYGGHAARQPGSSSSTSVKI